MTRARIVERGVALADAGGFSSVSMRNLAEELGAGTMALYRHVANKEDLLDGIKHYTAAGVSFPPNPIPFQMVVMRYRAPHNSGEQ